MKATIKVCAAAIIKQSKVLLTRRAASEEMGGGWEFPGGKIEADETPEECVLREIREELAIDIEVDSFCTNVQYEYESFFLDMDVYYCRISEGTIGISVHDKFVWAEIDRLLSFDLLPADILVAKKIISRE
ncbi:MAG: (deoxy)nucleoside triphosphate pyrophosphohydrolase [Clostridiaceae bacterium]|jgi:8-oxo-dGTP diphosphatase|nr:(deoxy)nucleoside triphosphate pyrophosphohydrolase [Clostridiaceae bacterium]